MAADNSDAQQLVDLLHTFPGCVVAFSGGVDSAVVAQAAKLALGKEAIAVTGVSASLAAGELQLAADLAATIGIQHETINTAEFERPDYLANQSDRCWHCKTELYEQLAQRSDRWGDKVLVNGTNADDLGDYRPGLRAAREHEVRSPLAECGFGKAKVRELALHWNLEVWDKPATPCLSSRVVYGLEVTPERLARIDAAEQALRKMGFKDLRVRYHHDDLARIEVHSSEVSDLCEPHIRGYLIELFRELGFRYVTLDLEGFRSGSFHQLISAEELAKSRG